MTLSKKHRNTQYKQTNQTIKHNKKKAFIPQRGNTVVHGKVDQMQIVVISAIVHAFFCFSRLCSAS